jgi:hypothetical protein
MKNFITHPYQSIQTLIERAESDPDAASAIGLRENDTSPLHAMIVYVKGEEAVAAVRAFLKQAGYLSDNPINRVWPTLALASRSMPCRTKDGHWWYLYFPDDPTDSPDNLDTQECICKHCSRRVLVSIQANDLPEV